MVRVRRVEAHPHPGRVAVVVHPTRERAEALHTLEAWAGMWLAFAANRLDCPLEVVKSLAPSVLVRAHGLLVP